MAAPHMLRRRLDLSYTEFSAFGPSDRVSRLIDMYIEAGATKFVARPACPPSMMMDQLRQLADAVVTRYHGSKVETVV